jgi:hypothetical protein
MRVRNIISTIMRYKTFIKAQEEKKPPNILLTYQLARAEESKHYTLLHLLP